MTGGRRGGNDPPGEIRGPGTGRAPESTNDREQQLDSPQARQPQALPLVVFGLHTPDDAPSYVCDDREWFSRNPTRSHRLRPAHVGELIGGSWVVTRQLRRGMRLRRGFSPPFEPIDSETIACAVFEAIVAATEAGRGWFPWPDIARRAQMLTRGGAA